MIRLTRANLQPIGIDIGHDSVKMLQLETVGPRLVAVAAARQDFSDEIRAQPELRLAAAVQIIRSLLGHNRFSGRRAVVALPRQMVRIKNLRLPSMPASEVGQAVHYEARNLFELDVEQARLHHLLAGEVRQSNGVRQELIVLAAKHQDVDNFLEQMHRSGLIVESLDAEPCALFRSVERFIRRKEDESEVHALVDVGWQRSQVLVGRGGALTFYKSLDLAGQHLSAAVSRKLGITPHEARALRRRLAETVEAPPGPDSVRQAVHDATRSLFEELAREVSLCLRYYSVTFRGQRPSRLRLVGGEACDGRFQSVLAAALSIPVEIARPLYSVDTSRLLPDQRRGMMCEWATAFGLGLRFTTCKFAPRDGKPRDPHATVPQPPTETLAPSVDVPQAIGAAREAVHV